MILGITNIGNGELAVIGLGMVGLYLIGHLGRQLIDLWIGSMRRQSTVDEHAAAALRLASKNPVPYAGFDHEPVTSERVPEYPEADEDAVFTGRHAVVPPVTPAKTTETTEYVPRVAQLPVDDEAALRVVRSLSPDGAR